MADDAAAEAPAAQTNSEYGQALMRAFGGALLFAFPLLMTMEMWQLGYSMARERLLIFLVGSLPMLLGLSYFAGFERTTTLRDEVLDALAAFGVGAILSAAMLALFGVLGAGVSTEEVVGKVAICTVPASIGALLATKQFGGSKMPREQRQAGYLGILFLMAVGSVFLAFNVAPTEEMILIAYQTGPFGALLLVLAALLVMHLIVFRLGFPGEDMRRGDQHPLRTFLIFTLPGYAVAVLISLYCLWSFGRTDGVAPHAVASMTAVLAFPAALGAATARLVV